MNKNAIATVTVIFATYNRDDSVRETLEAFLQLDLKGIQPQFVVVANNCSDSTIEVLHSFEDRLPLVIVEEPTPGKNRALNKALESVELLDLVVFCDDDITPRPDWLQEIVAASARNSDTSIFGGRIIPSWPSGTQPDWTMDPFLLGMGFSVHHLGPKAQAYPQGSYPFGPNFWVRESIFSEGRTYPENIGPKGTKRIMGSETAFLKQLEEEGYKARYAPNAVVRHRIKEADLHLPNLYRRAESCGRGRAHMEGVNYHNLLSDRRALWYARQLVKLLVAHLHSQFAILALRPNVRVLRKVKAKVELGRILESFRIAKAL